MNHGNNDNSEQGFRNQGGFNENQNRTLYAGGGSGLGGSRGIQGERNTNSLFGSGAPFGISSTPLGFALQQQSHSHSQSHSQSQQQQQQQRQPQQASLFARPFQSNRNHQRQQEKPVVSLFSGPSIFSALGFRNDAAEAPPSQRPAQLPSLSAPLSSGASNPFDSMLGLDLNLGSLSMGESFPAQSAPMPPLQQQQQHPMPRQPQSQPQHREQLQPAPSQQPGFQERRVSPASPSANPKPAPFASAAETTNAAESGGDLDPSGKEKSQPNRAQRFGWKSAGIFTVTPENAGPNRDILVSWRIPADQVSANSFDKSARGRNALDWIGLYRARQRIDCVQNHILVREIKATNHGKRGAYSTYDRRTGEVYGRVRLRTPRGVGQYDFRYFRGTDVNPDSGNPPSDSDHPPGFLPLPVARTNAVCVQVNGSDLFEALHFVKKTLSRRVIAAALQLSTLLGQVTSLSTPSRSKTQEGELVDLIANTIDVVFQKAGERRKMIEDQQLGKLRKVHDDCEAKLQAAIKKRGGNADPSAEAEEDDDELAKIKKSVSASAKSLSQVERDFAGLNAAMYACLDEVTRSKHLCGAMGREKVFRVIKLKVLYCVYAERFFSSTKELSDFVCADAGVDPAAIAHVLESPTKFIRLHADCEQKMKEMSAAIEAHAWGTLIPKDEFYHSRRALVDRIQSVIDVNLCNNPKRVDWPQGAKLRAFGSSANNFGGFKSDIDLCIVLPETATELSASQAIEDLGVVLEASGFLDVDTSRKAARIPILQFVDAETKIECDICINNRLALRNTALLRTYSLIDPRLRVMAAIIKDWSKKRNINNPAEHTLSSYAYILLLINFLQRCSPCPVLPVLQGGNFRKHCMPAPTPGPDGRLHDTAFFGDPEACASRSDHEAIIMQIRRGGRNAASVFELLICFFWEYGYAFNARRNVLSIRSGAPLDKDAKAAEDGWKLNPKIAIEDPFETSYDVAHVLRDKTHQRVRHEMLRAYTILAGCSASSPSAWKGATAGEILSALCAPA